MVNKMSRMVVITQFMEPREEEITLECLVGKVPHGYITVYHMRYVVSIRFSSRWGPVEVKMCR